MSFSTDANIKDSSRSCNMTQFVFNLRQFEKPRSTVALVTGIVVAILHIAYVNRWSPLAPWHRHQQRQRWFCSGPIGVYKSTTTELIQNSFTPHSTLIYWDRSEVSKALTRSRPRPTTTHYKQNNSIPLWFEGMPFRTNTTSEGWKSTGWLYWSIHIYIYIYALYIYILIYIYIERKFQSVCGCVVVHMDRNISELYTITWQWWNWHLELKLKIVIRSGCN